MAYPDIFISVDNFDEKRLDLINFELNLKIKNT